MSETTKRFLRSNSVRSRGRGRGRGRMHKVRQPVTYVRDSAMQSPQQTIRTSSGREVVVIDDPSTVTMSESEPEDWQGESRLVPFQNNNNNNNNINNNSSSSSTSKPLLK